MKPMPARAAPLRRRAVVLASLAAAAPLPAGLWHGAARAAPPPPGLPSRPATPVAAPPLGATAGTAPIGPPLPDTPLLGLNGPGRRLADFRGKPLIINVWASWCGPCRAEMASLERLAWSDAARRFAIIGVSTDDHAAAARIFLQRSNATISHFLDHGLVIERLLGATHLPLTVLVDAQGRVVQKIVGAREWDSAEALQLIGKAFAAAPGESPSRR